MRNFNYYTVLSYFIVFLISLLNQTIFTYLIVVLVIISILSILDKLGKGIVLRESIVFIYIFTCILMPLIGYEVYNFNNALALLWKNYMRVPKETYFGYAIPAISAFSFSLMFPFRKNDNLDENIKLKETFVKAKLLLLTNTQTGIKIISIGIVSFFLSNYLPVSLKYISSIIFFCSFAGLLYLYFTPNLKFKNLFLFSFITFLVANAIIVGMFTIVAFMSVTIFSFFFLGNTTSLLKKILFFILSIFLLIVIQNTKLTYRKSIWKESFTGNKTSLFADLFVNNIQKGESLFEKNSFFPIYLRSNQGFYVSLVMQRIPKIQNFDDGKMLTTAIISSFVPRFLWQDKPQAGGKLNMAYYTGRIIRGYSVNVGPLGEAYGSFGIAGGVFYMFLLGLFIRWVYLKIFIIANRLPLLIFWLPVFFYQVIYSAENDTLQILNSLVKTSILIYLLYRFFPKFFYAK